MTYSSAHLTPTICFLHTWEAIVLYLVGRLFCAKHYNTVTKDHKGSIKNQIQLKFSNWTQTKKIQMLTISIIYNIFLCKTHYFT